MLFKKIYLFIIFITLFSTIACEQKLNKEDIESYKQVMDVRLGHLGNALIMQGRLLDAYNQNNATADENHFKEAEELIKIHLTKLGIPSELKELDIPNSKPIKKFHNSIVESSELLIAAINMLEDQAWLGGSVSFAEASVDKARVNFQTVVKAIYNPKGEVKPITEHKEYDVGEKPELIELE
ncbi:MAG: hypothetical protein CMN00_01095 [Rickettsiales bacterium]|nr:hypothetical protein [Rickettsiales bacterium]MAY89769.1 hypothetical protein [Rickettsiales bacterium]|tara:strand:- start:1036 stop:1581 length:546 start_codon:yes stop_codon:yes gene_type:complete